MTLLSKTTAGCIGLILGLSVYTASAQQDHTIIKLYVDASRLDTALSDNIRDRIETTVTEMITNTGVAELGFSNFFMIPTFHLLSSKVDDRGMSRIFLKECELSIRIERHSYGKGGAVFNAWSKRIMGSGGSEEDALADAVNSISGSDPDLVAFLQQSKQKIETYFQTHCDEVIAEANQAYDLHDFARSIALFFSVPASAPADCYRHAQDGLHKTYSVYVNFDCKEKLIKLKAYVARAQSMDSATSHDQYDQAIAIVENLDPASDACFNEVEQIIVKIEGRFDEKQRQSWELKKKQAADQTEIAKNMIKAVGRISSTYQPAPTVVIAH
jgi:hypothetical protein